MATATPRKMKDRRTCAGKTCLTASAIGAEEDADDAADRRQQRGLQQELAADVLALRAPRARRTPISLVRSTTDTNMMLAITIAPTTSEMPEMRIISRKRPAEMPRQSVWSSSAVTRPNGSSAA